MELNAFRNIKFEDFNSKAIIQLGNENGTFKVSDSDKRWKPLARSDVDLKANNKIRASFLSALCKDLHLKVEDFPDGIKKALNLSKFGLVKDAGKLSVTGGKPLSSYRIQTVLKAVDAYKTEQQLKSFDTIKTFDTNGFKAQAQKVSQNVSGLLQEISTLLPEPNENVTKLNNNFSLFFMGETNFFVSDLENLQSYHNDPENDAYIAFLRGSDDKQTVGEIVEDKKSRLTLVQQNFSGMKTRLALIDEQMLQVNELLNNQIKSEENPEKKQALQTALNKMLLVYSTAHRQMNGLSQIRNELESDKKLPPPENKSVVLSRSKLKTTASLDTLKNLMAKFNVAPRNNKYDGQTILSTLVEQLDKKYQQLMSRNKIDQKELDGQLKYTVLSMDEYCDKTEVDKGDLPKEAMAEIKSAYIMACQEFKAYSNLL